MAIVTRELVVDVDGKQHCVLVELAAPYLRDRVWYCPYEIGWPHGARRWYGAGIDAVQALLIALQMIGAELYTSPYHQEGVLRWDKAGEGYGFPVASSLRHLLVGFDREMNG